MTTRPSATVIVRVYNRVKPPAGESPWTVVVRIAGRDDLVLQAMSRAECGGLRRGLVTGLELAGFDVARMDDYR